MLQIALSLPAPDVEALIQGRTIAAISGLFLTPGKQFVLYPADASTNALPLDKYYRSNFLSTAQSAQNQYNAETVLIKAWTKCELCQRVDNSDLLEALSRLTVWTTEALQEILRQQPHIFLAYLRVYQLHQPVEMPVNPEIQQKIGKFVGLPVSLNLTDSSPLLSDRLFAIRRHQLENRQPPPHPELEELQGAIAPLSLTNPAAKQLDEDLKIFLGWRETPVTQPDFDLTWIWTMANVGNSSDGNGFEKLVRKSLIKLGFSNSNAKPEASLNPDSTGGAGGLDFYCEAPYPVVGECKASKNESVPNSVSAQLIHLGQTHLGKAQFDLSIKIIVAAGPLTKQAQKAAVENQINVMRPETLQRLLELKAKHPGSINLFELKPLLQQAPFGEEADSKLNGYIDKVWQKIRLRSHVVHLVKDFLEKAPSEKSIGFSQLHGIYVYSSPPQPLLDREQLHEVTIELSSPLTGYLGRDESSDWESDRFYFLRDLLVD